ncbi:TRAP transporter small permease [Tranquillimonas alkanivorans]|uniref:TRAP transporter small permease protein n=1 Tax=Tranquillimonas alkanivorans TaxID=441119 RepID=A0A1I5UPU6_9RHOB|nr:TRAP transporter small permease [Tranquillimonas alkanivorans]SFP96656.1 TRAP-type C4-dicarboxylate transport system, small permease component [Tranquillimonas alkanivorans]
MNQLNSLFEALLRACAVVSGLVFASAAILISLNVVLRNVGGVTLFGLLDAVEYGLLLATFLGAPWVLSKNAHVTVDLVTGALPERLSEPLSRVTALIGFLICASLLWYATDAALASATRGSMIRTAFTIPEWWVLSVLPVSLALMCVEFLRQAAAPRSGARQATGL